MAPSSQLAQGTQEQTIHFQNWLVRRSPNPGALWAKPTYRNGCSQTACPEAGLTATFMSKSNWFGIALFTGLCEEQMVFAMCQTHLLRGRKIPGSASAWVGNAQTYWYLHWKAKNNFPLETGFGRTCKTTEDSSLLFTSSSELIPSASLTAI